MGICDAHCLSPHLFCGSISSESPLDVLHEEEIEIMSPKFVNQRQIGDTIFIPKKIKEKKSKIPTKVS